MVGDGANDCGALKVNITMTIPRYHVFLYFVIYFIEISINFCGVLFSNNSNSNVFHFIGSSHWMLLIKGKSLKIVYLIFND